MLCEKLTDYDQSLLAGRRVFIRADLNVPHDANGNISDDFRIRASLTGIRHALSCGAKVMVTSHGNRKAIGHHRHEHSLIKVGERLTKFLEAPVPLVKNWLNGGFSIESGGLVLLENCRFNAGEAENDPHLARRLASLCDIYVNDAFGTAHRAEATTEGIAQFAEVACAGPLLLAEIATLADALQHAPRPRVLIVGGVDVQAKIPLLKYLAHQVDVLIVGGAVATTFLAAQEHPTGRSIVMRHLFPDAGRVIKSLSNSSAELMLPFDVICSKNGIGEGPAVVKSVSDVSVDDFIMDIGPDSALAAAKALRNAGSIFWNGPAGAFEKDAFSGGTRVLTRSVAESEGYSVAGGGETTAAIEAYQVEKRIDYISTGGTALLHLLAGQTLPAAAVLIQRARNNK